METSTLGIDGMHCGACVGNIERALKAVAGVQSTVVSLKAGTATITFDPLQATDAVLAQAVAGAGYAIRMQSDPVVMHEGAPAGHCGSDSGKKKGGCCCG